MQFLTRIRRRLPRVKPAGIVTLLVSIIVADLGGAAVALLRHKNPADGSDAGTLVWTIVFGVWALLLVLQD